MDKKSGGIETLLGGRDVIVTRLDGSTETVKVRQISVGEFNRAVIVAEDDMRFAALACGKDSAWINKLQPDSFVGLVEAAQEVNKSFFAWFDRRKAKQYQQFSVLASSLSPEQLQAFGASVIGSAQSTTGFTSPSLLPSQA